MTHPGAELILPAEPRPYGVIFPRFAPSKIALMFPDALGFTKLPYRVE